MGILVKYKYNNIGVRVWKTHMIVYFDMGFYIYWHISGIEFTWNAPWVIHTFNGSFQKTSISPSTLRAKSSRISSRHVLRAVTLVPCRRNTRGLCSQGIDSVSISWNSSQWGTHFHLIISAPPLPVPGPIPLILGRSRKVPHSPHGGNFRCPEGEGRKNCFW